MPLQTDQQQLAASGHSYFTLKDERGQLRTTLPFGLGMGALDAEMMRRLRDTSTRE